MRYLYSTGKEPGFLKLQVELPVTAKARQRVGCFVHHSGVILYQRYKYNGSFAIQYIRSGDGSYRIMDLFTLKGYVNRLSIRAGYIIGYWRERPCKIMGCGDWMVYSLLKGKIVAKIGKMSSRGNCKRWNFATRILLFNDVRGDVFSKGIIIGYLFSKIISKHSKQYKIILYSFTKGRDALILVVSRLYTVTKLVVRKKYTFRVNACNNPSNGDIFLLSADLTLYLLRREHGFRIRETLKQQIHWKYFGAMEYDTSMKRVLLVTRNRRISCIIALPLTCDDSRFKPANETRVVKTFTHLPIFSVGLEGKVLITSHLFASRIKLYQVLPSVY
jgi:hypothetical protein